MSTCTRCSAPARWRDGNGVTFCGSHVPTNGKPLVRLPVPAVDIVDELLSLAGTGSSWGQTAGRAAAEIRRLRALVPSDSRQPGV